MRGLLALVVAASLAATVACASTADAPEETLTPSRTISVRPTDATGTSRPTDTPPGVQPIDIPFPSETESAVVTEVVDGDTIHVSMGGEEFTLRYIGVDSPETVDPNRPAGCYGAEASARNKALVEGKTVELERDASETDEFGRLLRYVWVDREMVNALLVRDGYAESQAYPPDTKHQRELDKLEIGAKFAGAGMWGPPCIDATPVGTTTQTPPPGTGDEICEFSGTRQPTIKGNISSSDEKIYHVPGQDSYDETGITASRGERWFCTEQEAIDAGWRKSRS